MTQMFDVWIFDVFFFVLLALPVPKQPNRVEESQGLEPFRRFTATTVRCACEDPGASWCVPPKNVECHWWPKMAGKQRYHPQLT